METKLAKAPWPKIKPPKQPKPKSKIDAKFEDWAAKNNVDLRDIPVLKKETK